MQCVGVDCDENMNGAGEQVDILPQNCMVKERWKVVSTQKSCMSHVDEKDDPDVDSVLFCILGFFWRCS